jgi:hypothetical protein
VTSTVSPQQRHTRRHRCPICNGAENDQRGKEARCYGFTSADGEWVHCMRPEHAGALSPNGMGAYVHKMHGPCKCGATHGEDPRRAGREIEATYDYRDEQGELLFQVVRFVGKDFRQRRPDGAGGWDWKLNGVRCVPYKLPELLEDDGDRVVYVVEGEKDADALARRGQTATTNPGGAGKWSLVADVARTALQGRDVTVIADRDEVGRRHALEVAESLKGVARAVRVLEPPGDVGGRTVKDVYDLLASGGALEQLVPLGTAPQPTATDPLRGLESLSKVAVLGAKRLRELAGIKPHFVWAQIAVAGTIVLIAAGPSEGKTTLLFLVLAARANTGNPVQVLARHVEPAPFGTWIVLIEGEHSESSAARKLFRSVALLRIDEACLDRVILIARKAVKLGSPEWQDVVRLVGAGLVSDIAIDTVARVAPSNADSEQEQAAIFDLVAQAIDAAPDEAHKPTVWANAHTRKNGRTGDVADVAGSVQRTGQADSVLMLEGEKVEGRTVATKVVFAKLREEPDEYPLPVTFAVVGDEVRVSTVADEADARPLETRIAEQLESGPKTGNALAEALRRSRGDVEEAISALFAAHRITTTYTTVRGQQRRAFTLRADTGRTIPDEESHRTTPDEHRTDS